LYGVDVGSVGSKSSWLPISGRPPALDSGPPCHHEPCDSVDGARYGASPCIAPAYDGPGGVAPHVLSVDVRYVFWNSPCPTRAHSISTLGLRAADTKSEQAAAPAKPKHFDLFIIGGGSGGLALSREAAWLGARVGLADFVDPSPAGTTWGLGGSAFFLYFLSFAFTTNRWIHYSCSPFSGTCVNVGCIPKKLFHTASLLGESLHDAQSYGWKLNPTTPTHDWQQLVQNVQAHIHSSNFVYRVRMQTDGIDYYNARASFVDANTIKLTYKNGRGNSHTRAFNSSYLSSQLCFLFVLFTEVLFSFTFNSHPFASHL
jgi:hypothetical protein